MNGTFPENKAIHHSDGYNDLKQKFQVISNILRVFLPQETSCCIAVAYKRVFQKKFLQNTHERDREEERQDEKIEKMCFFNVSDATTGLICKSC